jgi:5-methylcytosine-specific restriction endonuclease McrA
MAGDWMKIELELPDKPEVHELAGILNISPNEVVGCLVRVWAWFDKHTKDGNAKNVTFSLLDRLSCVTGFANAMQKVDWLISNDGILRIPDFDKHNGISAKSRAETSKRVAMHRENKQHKYEIKAEEILLISRPLKRKIFERDLHQCVYCGRREGEHLPIESPKDGTMHIDHVIPFTQGGTDDISNLATSCRACNIFKSNRTPDECGLRWPSIDGVKLGNKINVTFSLPEKRREEKIKNITPLAMLTGMAVNENLAKDWIKVRKEKKLAITQTALDKIKSHAESNGYTFAEAIKICVEKSWAGFNVKWLGDEYVPIKKDEYL